MADMKFEQENAYYEHLAKMFSGIHQYLRQERKKVIITCSADCIHNSAGICDLKEIGVFTDGLCSCFKRSSRK